MEKFFLFHRTTGSPVTGDLLYRYFQYKIWEKKIETRFFLPGIHQKYSSSSKCVDNGDIRMNKHKNLTFRLILRKKILGSSRARLGSMKNWQFKHNYSRFLILFQVKLIRLTAQIFPGPNPNWTWPNSSFKVVVRAWAAVSFFS